MFSRIYSVKISQGFLDILAVFCTKKNLTIMKKIPVTIEVTPLAKTEKGEYKKPANRKYMNYYKIIHQTVLFSPV